MPYKVKQKQSDGSKSLIKNSRSKYRVSNWSDYNESLKKRGSLTLWISDDIKDKWYVSKSSTHKRGGQLYYSDFSIMTFLTLRMVFKQPLRQTEGFMKSIFSLMKIDLEVPNYTRVSRRGDVPKITCKLESLMSLVISLLIVQVLKFLGKVSGWKTNMENGTNVKYGGLFI